MRQYLEQRSERYGVPARISLSQVYMSRDRRGAAVEDDARQVLDKLRSKSIPARECRTLGDPFMLQYDISIRPAKSSTSSWISHGPRPRRPPQTMTASADDSYRSLTDPSGTALPIRIAEGLSSETAKEGQRFSGFLDTELKVGDVIAAPRGSKLYGIVVEAEKAGSMSGEAKLILTLTDIDVNGRVLPIVSNKFKVEGASSFKDTWKKIAGGAIIGASVGTAASAATKGQQVAVEPQALFRSHSINR